NGMNSVLPGTAPALGLRAGNDVQPFNLQTNLEWENVPCHSRVGCATFDPLWLLSPPGARTGGNGHFGPRRTDQGSKSWKTVACRAPSPYSPSSTAAPTRCGRPSPPPTPTPEPIPSTSPRPAPSR